MNEFFQWLVLGLIVLVVAAQGHLLHEVAETLKATADIAQRGARKAFGLPATRRGTDT